MSKIIDYDELKKVSTDMEFSELGYTCMGHLPDIYEDTEHVEVENEYMRCWLCVNDTSNHTIVIADNGNGYSNYVCDFDTVLKKYPLSKEKLEKYIG